MTSRGSLFLVLAIVLAAPAASLGGCGTDNGPGVSAGGGDGGADGTVDGGGGLDGAGGDDGQAFFGDGSPPFVDDGGGSDYTCPGCPSFPASNAPTCAPATLGPAQLVYPIDGILLPPNMNVLEVQFVPPAGATLFEVDFWNAITLVKVETQCNQVPDVRGGASRGCGVTLPQAAWNDIANKNRDGDPVHVAVRATKDGSCVTQSVAKIDVSFAKEDLAGGIYYWQSATFGGIGGKTGGIYSHDFGTFDPTPTPFYTSGASGTCVGCHTLSRDGVRMAVMTDDPDGDDEYGDVHAHVMDVATRTVVSGGSLGPGFETFTHDHSKMISTNFKQKDVSFLVYNGDGTTLLSTQTLPAGVAGSHPDLSRDDTSLVFVNPAASSIAQAGDDHFKAGSLWAAAFDPASNAITGAHVILPANGRSYYYPSISPTGAFVLFNDAPQPGDTATTNDDAFYNRGARVKLVHFPPAAGATPIDLPALNVADGLTNSWPRWSPFVQDYKGHKLLWVTFSSNRDYGLHLVNKGFDNCYPPEGPTYDQPQPLSKVGVTYQSCAQPQIWMAAVLVDEDASLDATDRSFPAFWLPFQDVNSHNHSAQWVEKVQGPPGGGGDGGVGEGGAGDGGGGAGDAGGCVASGGACGGGASCCSDSVCCVGLCAADCLR